MNPLFRKLDEEIESFRSDLSSMRVASNAGVDEIRAEIERRFSFENPIPATELLENVSAILRQWNTHVTHPRYFGLFNPQPHVSTIAADALTALFNPQLGAWAHAPAAYEIERRTLSLFLDALGFPRDSAAAHFTSGGSEANHTAVIVALTNAFPEHVTSGLRSLPASPVFYVSSEAHHSFQKIAQVTGLGREALRVVETDEQYRMKPEALAMQLGRDRDQGKAPFLVVGTAGTTAGGVIDPLRQLGAICRSQNVWFHVDAAWGGAALLSKTLRPPLDGIELASSVTIDAHKWFSVPMGAGMYFSRDAGPVEKSFDVRPSYVPDRDPRTRDYYATTLQWSRRFIGLKLFFILAELGVDGVAGVIERHAATADRLRQMLEERGWLILNDTPFPLVCFTHPAVEAGEVSISEIAGRVVESGDAWISRCVLGPSREAIRACITSFETTERDLEILLEVLDRTLPERFRRPMR